jgi:hypothetical protein
MRLRNTCVQCTMYQLRWAFSTINSFFYLIYISVFGMVQYAQVLGSKPFFFSYVPYVAVFWIRKFLGLPDLLIRDKDPDPSIIKQI